MRHPDEIHEDSQSSIGWKMESERGGEGREEKRTERREASLAFVFGVELRDMPYS